MHYLSAGRSVDSLVNAEPDNAALGDSEECDWIVKRRFRRIGFLAGQRARYMSLLTPHLQGQEKAVLECFADGLRVREIGRKLSFPIPW